MGSAGTRLYAESRYLISSGDDQTVRIWDLGPGREVGLLRGPRSGLQCVAVSPDGTRIAAGTFNGKIWMWDFETHRKLMRMDCGSRGPVNCVAFSSDGKRVASGGFQNIKIWDATNGHLLRSLGPGETTEEDIQDVEFTPDGKHIVARGTEVFIWDIDRGICASNLGKVGDIRAIVAGSERFPFRIGETTGNRYCTCDHV